MVSVIRWGLFAVIPSLAPFAWPVLAAISKSPPGDPYRCLDHGELIIVSVVLACAGLGEAIRMDRQTRERVILAGLSLLFVIVSSIYFGVVLHLSEQAHEQVNLRVVRTMSVVLFFAAALISTSAIILADSIKSLRSRQ
jgi:hypothetical protein